MPETVAERELKHALAETARTAERACARLRLAESLLEYVESMPDNTVERLDDEGFTVLVDEIRRYRRDLVAERAGQS